MSKTTLSPIDLTADPVPLAAAAVHSLIQTLPAGTAFCIGIVFIVMMTGRLVQTKGSLARAVFPFIAHLRWGWQRVERVMERGKGPLDPGSDRAHGWCLANLPLQPVRLGEAQRELHAIDSSTIARLRAGTRLALAGKGYCHRAGRAVRANIVAALTQVVIIGGIRVGLVRRMRFGSSCQAAVECLCANLPPTAGQRLLVVDDVERTLPGEAGAIRLRRWSTLHYEDFPETILDVVRIDDPTYDVPLIVGSTARDLRLEEFWSGYQHRWPVETNFFVAQDTAAMEMPRAWTQTALERRIGLALLVGTLLKAIAAVCKPQAIGPWDRQPVRSAGRLANYLDLHAERFIALALKGIAPRNYQKNPNRAWTKDLRPRKAA